MICLGTITNQEFLKQLVRNKEVIQGNTIHFLADKFQLKDQNTAHQKSFLIAATLKLHEERNRGQVYLKHIPGGWRNNYYRPQQESFKLNNEIVHVEYRQKEGDLNFTLKKKPLK